MDFVKLELRPPVAIVTLDRPDCLNALNNQVYEEIIATLQDVEKNSDIKVVILTGAGDFLFTYMFTDHPLPPASGNSNLFFIRFSRETPAFSRNAHP